MTAQDVMLDSDGVNKSLLADLASEYFGPLLFRRGRVYFLKVPAQLQVLACGRECLGVARGTCVDFWIAIIWHLNARVQPFDILFFDCCRLFYFLSFFLVRRAITWPFPFLWYTAATSEWRLDIGVFNFYHRFIILHCDDFRAELLQLNKLNMFLLIYPWHY